MKINNLLLMIFLTISIIGFAQGVGIGTKTPDISSILDIRSTSGGILMPRLTTIQRKAILNPAIGLIIFNTTTNCYEWYNSKGWYNSCTLQQIVEPTSGGTSVFSLINCAAGSTGTLALGEDASGMTQTIWVNVSQVGSWSISTLKNNNVVFSGSGTFTTTGDQNIVLTAKGIPNIGGVNLFTLNTTPDCTFSQNVTGSFSPTSNGTSIIDLANCSTSLSGILIAGTPALGVTQTISVNVNTVGSWSILAANDGITFAGSGKFTTTGLQDIVLTATGTPLIGGNFDFTINTTLNCTFNFTVNPKIETIIGAAGKEWMKWNLGATAVATSYTDYTQYGSLYQWGRGPDGHQLINWTGASSGTAVNGTTTTLSTTDTPGNSLFITRPGGGDWRATRNDIMWDNSSNGGVNNPCPQGFRVPSSSELSSEFNSQGIGNGPSGYNSTLKLTGGAFRNVNGSISIGANIGYWTSTASASSDFAIRRTLTATGSATSATYRVFGFYIRCIKD